MVQFDLKVWLQDKSREVITRAGKQVRIVCWDSPNKTFPIVGFVNNEEEIFTWDRFGYCREGHIESDVDLVFADVKENLSEDDRIREEIVDYLKRFIPHTDIDLVTKSKGWINWLKSIKPNNWKPSDEQIEMESSNLYNRYDSDELYSRY